MKVIRKCIFETNSSTTHSCVIMTEDEHKKWEEGLYYYQPSGWYDPFKSLPEEEKPKSGMFYTQEEILEILKKDGSEYNPEEFEDYDNPVDRFIYEYGDGMFISYSSWLGREFEEDTHYYTTPIGEKIIVECKYGYE